MTARFVALICAALCLGTASGAAADPPMPSPAPTPVDLPTLPPASTLNPYVKAAIDLVSGVVRARSTNDANSANGQVTYFKRFDLQIRTGPNRYRNVHLHQGTAINPRGESIQTGAQVSIGGVGQPDGSLDANTIDIQH